MSVLEVRAGSSRRYWVVETEAIPMNKHLRICGFVLLAGILLNAQDVFPVPTDNSKDVLARGSEQFVELLRRDEAGDEYAQFDVANAYGSGAGIPKDDAEAYGRGYQRRGKDWLRRRSCRICV